MFCAVGGFVNYKSISLILSFVKYISYICELTGGVNKYSYRPKE
jgi:hypothetical protein